MSSRDGRFTNHIINVAMIVNLVIFLPPPSASGSSSSSSSPDFPLFDWKNTQTERKKQIRRGWEEWSTRFLYNIVYICFPTERSIKSPLSLDLAVKMADSWWILNLASLYFINFGENDFFIVILRAENLHNGSWRQQRIFFFLLLILFP